MYIPAAYRVDDISVLHDEMRAARLSTLVTMTTDGLAATPVPLILNEREGPYGTLYGHFARANPQWKSTQKGDVLALFMRDNAYVSPSWYASKRENGRVVPTWIYVAVHAYGSVEFFEDPSRLLDVVTQLTNMYEAQRGEPWKVSDAPGSYIRSQLQGIVGLRMPISRLEGKKKMEQDSNAADRAGVVAGLASSDRLSDREIAPLITK